MQVRHLIPNDIFEKMISYLTLRDRAIAKLLYFGAPILQKHVFSLRIDQVDFENNRINFDSEFIDFERDVFLDLDILVGKRKTGYVFIGRHEKKIDPTVPFRALKKAARDVGLGADFSLKHLSVWTINR